VAAIEDVQTDERQDDRPTPTNYESAAYGSLKGTELNSTQSHRLLRLFNFANWVCLLFSILDVTIHKQAIDQLHEGHGQSWLVVYNELKKAENSPSNPKAKKSAATSTTGNNNNNNNKPRRRSAGTPTKNNENQSSNPSNPSNGNGGPAQSTPTENQTAKRGTLQANANPSAPK